jgi:hypothetical protein
MLPSASYPPKQANSAQEIQLTKEQSMLPATQTNLNMALSNQPARFALDLIMNRLRTLSTM